jgi:hypothetical protein
MFMDESAEQVAAVWAGRHVQRRRAHPTFGMSVRVRSLNGRTDHLDPLGVIHCPSDLKVGRATAGRQVPLAASPRGHLPLVLLLAEPHLDFLLFVVGGLVGVQLERSVVGVGLRAADEAARVEALRQHDVALAEAKPSRERDLEGLKDSGAKTAQAGG